MHSMESKGIESLKFPGEVLNQQELRIFNFEKLAMATNNFHSDTMLGEGGFGQVYMVKFIISVFNCIHVMWIYNI